MTNEDWINTFINKFNESKDYKITDARDREKLLDELRPTGEWIVTAEDNEGVHRIQCPFCGYEKGSNFVDTITVIFERMPKFCENCGAKMKG